MGRSWSPERQFGTPSGFHLTDDGGPNGPPRLGLGLGGLLFSLRLLTARGKGITPGLSQLIPCPSSRALIFQPEEAFTAQASPGTMLFHLRGMGFPCAVVAGPHLTLLFPVGSPSRALVSAEECQSIASGGLPHLFLWSDDSVMWLLPMKAQGVAPCVFNELSVRYHSECLSSAVV